MADRAACPARVDDHYNRRRRRRCLRQRTHDHQIRIATAASPQPWRSKRDALQCCVGLHRASPAVPNPARRASVVARDGRQRVRATLSRRMPCARRRGARSSSGRIRRRAARLAGARARGAGARGHHAGRIGHAARTGTDCGARGACRGRRRSGPAEGNASCLFPLHRAGRAPALRHGPVGVPRTTGCGGTRAGSHRLPSCQCESAAS